VIVITGGSSGVGAALTRLLAKDLPDCHLVVLARSADLLIALKEEIERECRPGRCDVFAVDCSDGEALKAVARKVGRAGIVVANAGAGTFRAIWEREATPEETNKCLLAPLSAALHTAHAFLPAMVDAGEGIFLAVQSPASRIPWPGATAYTAARFGLRGVIAALSQDLFGRGVKACEVIIAEVTDSAYFLNNPGSKQRVPAISPWFGEVTCAEAALGIRDALISGAPLSFSPFRYRLAFASMAFPGIETVVLMLLRLTGWRGNPEVYLYE